MHKNLDYEAFVCGSVDGDYDTAGNYNLFMQLIYFVILKRRAI